MAIFFLWEEFFKFITLWLSLSFPMIFYFIPMPFPFNNVLFNGVIVLFILCNNQIEKRYGRKIESSGYWGVTLAIASFTALGSFSKQELTDIGFCLSDDKPILSYFMIKWSFFFWAMILLPVVLGKVFDRQAKLE